MESYLEDGRQNEPEVFGKSITDPCLGWENTGSLVREIYQTLGENKMAFIEKGQEIDIEAIKAETQLSVGSLALKDHRDRELADIISGEG